MSKERLNLSVGIEIGTTKVCLVVANADAHPLEVLSTSQSPHKGIHQGQIVDTQEIVFALQKVKSEAEIIVGQTLTSVSLTLADNTLETLTSKGMVSVKKVIKSKDIESVMASAKESAQVRSDREILQVLPQFFKVEGVRFDEAPLKIKSTSVEVSTLLITVNKKNLQMAKDCLKTAGLEVSQVVAQPVASAYGASTTEERQEGLAVMDLGGHMTHVSAFKKGRLCYVSAVSLGGANFTQDLAVGLRTPQSFAEKIKRTHGAALVDLVSPEETLQIESLKGEEPRTIPARLVCEILEARSEETLALLLKKLNDEDLIKDLKRGVILTGGASQLPGLPELGEFTFDIPLRRQEAMTDVQNSTLVQNPAISAALGVLLFTAGRRPTASMSDGNFTFKDGIKKLKEMMDNIL